MKRYVLVFSVFVALALLVGTSGSAMAATYSTDTTSCIGSQCVYVPAGGNQTNLVGKDITVSRASMSYPYFSETPIQISWKGNGVMPLTYVFFELQGWEYRAWQAGALHILYNISNTSNTSTGNSGPNSKGNWQVCQSWGVSTSTSGNGGRIACVIPVVISGNVTFGKGTLDRSDLPFQYAGAK